MCKIKKDIMFAIIYCVGSGSKYLFNFGVDISNVQSFKISYINNTWNCVSDHCFESFALFQLFFRNFLSSDVFISYHRTVTKLLYRVMEPKIFLIANIRMNKVFRCTGIYNVHKLFKKRMLIYIGGMEG